MVAKTTSVALGDHVSDYTRSRVESGEYGSTSEVIRDAFRVHEARPAFKSRLTEALDAGLASTADEKFGIDKWYDEEFVPKCAN